MKIVITIWIVFGALHVYAQNIDSLFVERKLPQGLTVTIEKDSAILGDFSKKYIAKVTFKSNAASVYFFVFVDVLSDSIAFKNAQSNFWIVSGCNIVSNNDINKNFTSFKKTGYFFLLQHCACKTGENKDCAELAKRINEWRK